MKKTLLSLSLLLLAAFGTTSRLSAQTILASWAGQFNTGTGTYPASATYKNANRGITAAFENYQGVSTSNTYYRTYYNNNYDTTLDINTANYISYTITTSDPTIFDRFVLPGLSSYSKMQLRWSVDSFSNSLGEFTIQPNGSFGITSVNLLTQDTVAAGTTEFRIYCYKAPSNSNQRLIRFVGGDNNYPSPDNTPIAFRSYGGNAIFGYPIIPCSTPDSISLAVANPSCTNAPYGTISLTLNGGVGYFDLAWTGPNGYTSKQQNLYGLDTGTYTVIASAYSNECPITKSVTLTAPAPSTPFVSIVSDPFACSGVPFVFTALVPPATVGGPGSSNYFVWYKNGSYVTDGYGVNTYTESNLASTDSFYVELYKYGCVTTNNVKSDTVGVEVRQSPVAIVAGPDTVTRCKGTTITLQATQGAGYSYKWQKNGTDIPVTQPDITIKGNGSYTITTTFDGCSATSLPVTVGTAKFLVNPSVTSTANTICAGDSIVLNAVPNPAYSYEWRKNGGIISGATSDEYVATSIGNYRVRITTGACGGKTRTSGATMILDGNCGTPREALEAAQANAFSVYPNPSDGTFYIASNELVDATVTDLQGRTLLQIINAKVIDMNAYAAGVYLLQLKDKTGAVLHTERLVKQ